MKNLNNRESEFTKMHDKVREVISQTKSVMMNCIEAKDDTLLMEQEKMLHRWKEYIGELFAGNQGSRPGIQRQEANR